MAIGCIYRKYSFLKVLRNWLVVYFGNLLGAMVIAWLTFHSGLLGSPSNPNAMGVVAAAIADAKLKLGFMDALYRGVLCNMLVCLAVIMSIAAKSVTGKIFGIYFPIMAFVASGFEHSVANMYFLPVGLMAKGASASSFPIIFNNLIPVTIGNIIGGLLIVLLHPKVEKEIFHVLFRRDEHRRP
jgi:formate/nitrite transporter